MGEVPAPGRRYHDLDALRAFAMFLGVAWHAAVVYGRDATRAGVSGDLHLWFAATSHAFRLPVFFLLAGFFAAMVHDRGGPGRFVRQRAVRIGVPLVVGMLTLSPLVAVLSRRYYGVAAPDTADLFRPYHLWFLLWLLIYYAVALGIERLRAPCEFGDRVIRVLVISRWRLIPLVGAGLVIYAACGGPGRVPGLSWAPRVSLLALYGLFFTVGWLMWRRRERLPELAREPWRHGALALAASIAFAVLVHQGWAHTGESSWFEARHVAADTLSLLIAWSALFALFGLFVRVLSEANPRVRYLADSVYWLYLVHLPLLWLAGIGLADVGIPWELRLLIALAAASAVALASYALVVRHSFIGRVLHGPRPRVR